MSVNLLLIHLSPVFMELLSFPSLVSPLYKATRFFRLSSGSLEVANRSSFPAGPLKL
ncbi:hypothetical protein QJS10_CPB13g00349 [Acorus calamus]|uniref:Uncharacterized protein n=1 Tax=Acorus calamus TaxID=4465 RepID=A0AAV9DH62_ACOCL|nr:hypothetical protein QJS10_CPB13g00349 [Acorus calamus]